MPVLRKRIQYHAAAAAGSAVLDMLSRTWRVAVDDREGMLESVARRRRAHIAVFWHRHLLSMLSIFRGYPVHVPVSEHRDGEYVAHLLARCGMLTVRGSTTHGGLNLARGLVRRLHSGASCAITPDGPRGPSCRVQPGAVMLARRTGVPIHPVGVAVNRGWEFNSWDALIVPRPWAGISVVIGQGLLVPPGGDIRRSCDILQDRIDRCTEQAMQRHVPSSHRRRRERVK